MIPRGHPIDLAELYQEVILDHGKRPRNFRVLENADMAAEGFNPLCGDRVEVQVRMDVDGETIAELCFQGQGCAVCMASASLMSEQLNGQLRETALRTFGTFQELMTAEERPVTDLGKLEALAGVRRFPMRIKCATLPWHTMRAALQQDSEAVTTE